MASRRDVLIMLGVGLAAATAGVVLAPRLGHPPAGSEIAALRGARLTGLDGQPARLDALNQHILVCNFWATWCPPCVEEIPALMRVRESYKARNVEFVGIAIDQAAKVREFATKLAISYPVFLADGSGIELVRTLGNPSGGLPFTLVFDRSRQVAARKLGALSEQEMARMLDQALAS